MKHGASTTRNFRCFVHFATMWRTFWLLSLMLFMSDFPHERFVRAESTRADKELISAAVEETQRGVRDEDSSSSEIAGSWRNNGEALEPQWRDGDITPLLPWVHLVQYAKDELETAKHTHNDQPDRKSPEKTIERLSRQDNPDDYEPPNGTERYNNNPRNKYIYQRRNNDREESRVPMSLRVPNNDEREKRKFQSKDVTSVKYSEAFQVYPNAYEQELVDEEYLRPRPRKRRPPQNYEFALAADEASLRDKIAKAEFKSWPHTSIQPEKAETIDSKLKNIDKSQISQNAVELKSLLKMQQKEGLSLSELLQRKNLTLNDLLKGKADAISVLKSKDSNENDEFIEETPKMVSNSLKKTPIIKEEPFWGSITELPEFNHTKQEDKLLTLNVKSPKSKNNDQYSHQIDTDAMKTSENLDKVKINSNNQNHTVDKTILHTLKPVKENISATMSPIMIITPTYSLTSTDVSETTLNDESNIGTDNSHNIKYTLDEDEIMEFSDFPNFRTEKNSGSPIWITLRDDPKTQSIEPIQSTSNDKTSTLNIEHILSSMKRTHENKNSSTVLNKQPVSLFTTKTDELIDGKRYSMINQDDTNDYGALEHEYQDDAPAILDEDQDGMKNTSMDSKDKEMVKVMEKIESTLAEISRQNNLSVENEKAIVKPVQSFDQGSSKNHRTSHIKDKRYEDTVSEVEPDARAEIFELFASSSAGKRLERLLKSRNMSVEELIALRQRGSSKVHLAEVSRLRVQKLDTTSPRVDGRSKSGSEIPLALQPEESYVVNNDRKKLDINRTRSHLNINAKSTLHETKTKTEEHNESTTTTTNFANFIHQDENSSGSKNNTELDTNNKHDATTFDKDEDETLKKIQQQLPDRMVEVVDLLTTFASLPFAKNIYQDIIPKFTESDESENWRLLRQNNELKENKIDDQLATMQFHSNSPKMIESDFTEQIIKEQPNSIDIRTLFCDTCLTDRDEENRDEERKSLSRVRSSIIASGAVLGVTVVVFLAIFIACRVRQKQKYRYRNTFSRAVFQGPMLAARKLSNSSSLSNVMVDVIATSTTKRLERCTTPDNTIVTDPKSDIDSDSLDANDSWETIPDYMK